MSDQRPDDAADAAYVERMAAPLRAPVHFDDGFDDRVMAAVRAEAAGRGSWWRTRRPLAVSPLVGFAAAAGFAAIVAGATLVVAGRPLGGAATSAQATAADTVTLVRFVFVDGNARHVSLAGDFNGWNTTATPLVRTGVDGVWAVSIPVRRGRYEYAYVVDGKRWTADPLAAAHSDEYDTPSSVLTVGTLGQ